MNRRKVWRYISNRIILFSVILMIFLVLTFMYDALHFLRLGQGGIRVIASGAVMILFAVIVWFSILRPYYQSERLIQRFLDGHMLSEDVLKGGYSLTPSVEQLLDKVEKIQNSPKTMDLNRRQAQYLALQNQINPHFLYNTLESIRGEALIAGVEGVSDMTEALAKFFRYTISKVENDVTVEEELENCETYFHIQKYRFGERLQLYIDYDHEDWNEISTCKIPKLTLQPLLENAIIHGTELKIGTGTLRISFERTASRLIIRVSDDGVGMDEETLKKLNRKLGRDENDNEAQEKKGSIALVNVNRRIHLLYGEEYGLHVYSVPQKGTDVELTIPFQIDQKRF